MKKNLAAFPDKAKPADDTGAKDDTETVMSPIGKVPPAIRRAVLEKQLEQYFIQAADNFGAYEVTLRLYPRNNKQLQQYFELMNTALANAEIVRQLISEIPVEVQP
jgi:hypothetical protein